MMFEQTYQRNYTDTTNRKYKERRKYIETDQKKYTD